MKKTLKLMICMMMGCLSLSMTSCENYPEGVPSFYSSEYRIVGVWQIAHTYLNGVEIDSTDYTGYAVNTYYYMYADHVMAVRANRNGEWRESIFATYILDPKKKTIALKYTLMGKNYDFVADVRRLSKKEFFIEFDDENGDHWRLEMFSRSGY